MGASILTLGTTLILTLTRPIPREKAANAAGKTDTGTPPRIERARSQGARMESTDAFIGLGSVAVLTVLTVKAAF
jgi:hypothetical protein